MSNFSGQHLVTKFDSKKSQALTGQRLAKVTYKNTAKNPAKFPSICVSVPFVDMGLVDYGRISAHIRTMLESAQDGIIKSLYESSEGSVTAITDTDISFDAIVKYLEAESTGSRMTCEFITAWFNESAADTVTALIAEKLGYGNDSVTEDQMVTINRHVNAYRELFSSLAGGKTFLQPNQIKSLKNVLGFVDADDTSIRLNNRLIAMENKPKIEDVLEL